MMIARWSVAGLVFSLALVGEASAGTLDASELATDTAILRQYNLVNFGNYYAHNETEGRIVVGGDMIADTSRNAGFNGHGGDTTTAINGVQYGDVTVFGSVSGGFNPGGDVYIAGSASGTFSNLNGASFNVVGPASGASISGAGQINTAQARFAGTAQNTQSSAIHTGLSAASVFPYGSSITTNFQTPLTDLARALAVLASTPGVTAQALPNPSGGNLQLQAAADFTSGGKTYGVITTTYDNLAAEQTFMGINNNGNAATFVIVTGNDASVALPGLNGNNNESNVIWDFVDATTLRFSGTWYGTILAPSANVTQQGGNLTGPVVVNSLTQTSELHFDYGFLGDLSGLAGLSTGTSSVGSASTVSVASANVGSTSVPEPSSIVLMGVSLLGLGLVGRRAGRTPPVADASR